MEKITSLDYDDYKEYKRDYDKQYNLLNKEKNKKKKKKKKQQDPD